MLLLFQKNDGLDKSDPKFAVNLIVHDQFFQRDKRCVLAYLYERLQRLKRLYREKGHTTQVEDFFRNNMSSWEQEFLQEYDTLFASYNTAIGSDLGSDLNAPRDAFVQVKVLKDYGEIVLTGGSGGGGFGSGSTIRLTKDSVYFLSENDADPLIAKGIVKRLQL